MSDEKTVLKINNLKKEYKMYNGNKASVPALSW